MKASEAIKIVCDAWEHGAPAKVQAAMALLKVAKEGTDEWRSAKNDVTIAQGIQGRVGWLRTSIETLIKQFGDVEVPLEHKK